MRQAWCLARPAAGHLFGLAAKVIDFLFPPQLNRTVAIISQRLTGQEKTPEADVGNAKIC